MKKKIISPPGTINIAINTHDPGIVRIVPNTEPVVITYEGSNAWINFGAGPIFCTVDKKIKRQMDWILQDDDGRLYSADGSIIRCAEGEQMYQAEEAQA